MPAALVTGATRGIGAEIALLLAAGRGCDLVLLNRSRAASAAILDRLRAAAPARAVEVVEADLAEGDALRAAAADIAARHPRLDALFNNAGILLPRKRPSRHGTDLHLQVNVLAPYILMRGLRAPLAAARGVVLNVSSGAAFMAGRLRVADLRDAPPSRSAGIAGPYAQSKLALTTLTNALAPEYEPDGVVLRSADPGGNRTGMTKGEGMPAILRRLVVPLFFKSPEAGAREMVDAAFAAQLGRRTGVFVKGGRVKAAPADANDPAVQRALVQLCRELTGA